MAKTEPENEVSESRHGGQKGTKTWVCDGSSEEKICIVPVSI